MGTENLDKYRRAWKRAATFSLTKEEIYPELAKVQEFDEHHGKEVLEYGVGSGSDALSYLRRGNFVTCCDIVPENIIVAKENIRKAGFTKETKFVLLEDSFPLSFSDDTFDVVNGNGVIHHIPKGKEVVREFYRVLRSGGLSYIMLYSEYFWDYFSSKIKEFMKCYKIDEFEAFCWCTDAPNMPYARKYTEDEGREMIEQCGFTLEKMTLYNRKYFREFKMKKSR